MQNESEDEGKVRYVTMYRNNFLVVFFFFLCKKLLKGTLVWKQLAYKNRGYFFNLMSKKSKP